MNTSPLFVLFFPVLSTICWRGIKTFVVAACLLLFIKVVREQIDSVDLNAAIKLYADLPETRASL